MSHGFLARLIPIASGVGLSLAALTLPAAAELNSFYTCPEGSFYLMGSGCQAFSDSYREPTYFPPGYDQFGFYYGTGLHERGRHTHGPRPVGHGFGRR